MLLLCLWPRIMHRITPRSESFLSALRPGAGSSLSRPTCSPEFLGFLLLLLVVWPVVVIVVAAGGGSWFGTACPISGQPALQKQEANGIFSLHLQDDLFCLYFCKVLALRKRTFNFTRYMDALRGDLRHLLALLSPTKAAVGQIIE